MDCLRDMYKVLFLNTGDIRPLGKCRDRRKPNAKHRICGDQGAHSSIVG
jgi:hypothetical protein